jgi:hypothetical protein
MENFKMEEKIELPNCLDRAKRFVSKGLEDIRLYEHNGKLKFIATTIQYSPLGQNRMVIGEYDISEKCLHSVELIEPPDANIWCEKNWIPIKYSLQNKDGIQEDSEYFIYGWSPFQVGRLVPENTEMPEFSYKLEIVLKKEYPNILFLDKFRGSTPFIPFGDRLVGLVHFSEEYTPRHYYHMLIQLEKDTLDIVERSQPFYFQRKRIEFCIGFTLSNIESQESFCFWISQMDREPLFQTIPTKEIRWTKI